MEKLWIDALDFDDYGGYIAETQFVREMGQPYLLANGAGEPVSPASVKFSVREGGSYRFFIRTKNWCSEHSPDGLVLEVDGVRSKHVCAEMHICGWYFEIGADFDLSIGDHVLKVYDTKGWFGRFAAVIITNDYDFTPSRDVKMLKKQRASIKGLDQKITDKGRYDLIVVGGGVGGIVAAITASRYGLKTALINDRPKLGGNAAEEANVALEGAAHRGFHETGIVYEIKCYRTKLGITWSEVFAKFVEDEKNLDLFPDMHLIDAETDGGRIIGICTVGTRDLKEYRFSADAFVDGTGDGWLGYYSGAAYRIGREARFQHGESFAPETADGNTMSGCATGRVKETNETVCGYYAEKTSESVEFKAPEWAFKLPEGDSLGRTPTRLERGLWWLEMPNDYDDVFESEYVRDSMFRMALGYFDWMKNSWGGREAAKNYKLKQLGTYNAKRESRRLIGDYIITENDYVDGKTYPDAISYCGWNIDVHHVGGIFSGKEGAFTANKKIPITPLPFGALYSKNIENLMMVGRCISVTHIGLGPARVQLTAGTMGQAVSAGAYLCKKYATTPRGVRRDHIEELQQLLIKDGIYIPGVRGTDGNDLAQSAVISATSYAEGGDPCNVVNGKMQIADGGDYAWISNGNMPESITLSFDSPKSVSEVRVTFDIPFPEYKYGYMPQPTPKHIASDLSVSLLVGGDWVEIKRISDNIQRLVVMTFPKKVAEAVRITVYKASGADRVIIPEIRIY